MVCIPRSASIPLRREEAMRIPPLSLDLTRRPQYSMTGMVFLEFVLLELKKELRMRGRGELRIDGTGI
jgi:hypothetical protein